MSFSKKFEKSDIWILAVAKVIAVGVFAACSTKGGLDYPSKDRPIFSPRALRLLRLPKIKILLLLLPLSRCL